jgi:hypothetical protein
MSFKEKIDGKNRKDEKCGNWCLFYSRHRSLNKNSYKIQTQQKI